MYECFKFLFVCFSLFKVTYPCVCSIPGHKVRLVHWAGTPGEPECLGSLATFWDLLVPNWPRAWKQMHPSWQRNKKIAFLLVLVFSSFPDWRHWVSEKLCCPLRHSAQRFHCWNQHMLLWELSRNCMWTRAGGGLFFLDIILYPCPPPTQKHWLFAFNLFVRFNISSNIGPYVWHIAVEW